MTNETINAIMNTVHNLLNHNMIHEGLDYEGEVEHCMGCPFRGGSTYLDGRETYHQGICDREKLYFRCDRWEKMMGADL